MSVTASFGKKCLKFISIFPKANQVVLRILVGIFPTYVLKPDLTLSTGETVEPTKYRPQNPSTKSTLTNKSY